MSTLFRSLPLLALLAPAALMAQRPTIEDFTLSGDTYRTPDDCYRLTEERDYSSGAIWYKRTINLAEPFSIELSVMLGCQDEEGADGMVFVFTPLANRTGGRGEGIGFGGLYPSLGIEIDTWRNYHLDDPADDHLAIMVNGRVNHYGGSLAGPVLIPNIEDCKRHRLAIRWRPNERKILVEIDTKEVISANVNLVSDVFQGNSEVYWGVTAATGRYNNIHEVCFDRLSFVPKGLKDMSSYSERER